MDKNEFTENLIRNIEAACAAFGEKVTPACMNAGLGRAFMSDLRKGRVPSVERIQRLADYLGVSTSALLGENYKEPSPGYVRIPVMGRVVAGIPGEAVQDIIEWEEIPEALAADGEYFALQIKGKSMEPRMCEGDVVVVKRQPDAENGDIAVVLVNGEDAAVKRIKKGPEGLMLVSTNPVFEPMFFSNNEIEQLPVVILGKVVELRAKF